MCHKPFLFFKNYGLLIRAWHENPVVRCPGSFSTLAILTFRRCWCQAFGVEHGDLMVCHGKYSGVPLAMGVPKWMNYFMENPNPKWMMKWGTPITLETSILENDPWKSLVVDALPMLSVGLFSMVNCYIARGALVFLGRMGQAMQGTTGPKSCQAKCLPTLRLCAAWSNQSFGGQKGDFHTTETPFAGINPWYLGLHITHEDMM